MMLDPRLILDWQKRPMTTQEAGQLAEFLDAVGDVFREVALIKGQLNSHIRTATGCVLRAKTISNMIGR